MSAFICSPTHIITLAHAMEKKAHHVLALELALENIKSVEYRYGEDAEEMFGVSKTAFLMECVTETPKTLSRVGLYKLACCYEYQACEHEEWEGGSLEKKISAFKRSLNLPSNVEESPAYSEAAWSI